MAKKKHPATDGLGPRERERIRAVLRQVWFQCHAHKLVRQRCTGKDGFARCENKECLSKGKRVPKVYVDHIERCGDVDTGFIKRLFTPSKNLQGLCKKCHAVKTAQERALAKKALTPVKMKVKNIKIRVEPTDW